MGGHRQKARCIMRQLTNKKARRLARKAERLLIKVVAIEMAETEHIKPYLSKSVARHGVDTVQRSLDCIQTVRF